MIGLASAGPWLRLDESPTVASITATTEGSPAEAAGSAPETPGPAEAAAGPQTQGGPGAAGVHDESFAANRRYDETTATPRSPATPAEGRPVNGQRALDDSFPVGRDPADPAAPAQRIGVDVENQQLVVLTRAGQRVQGGRVVGGTYRGRVAKWDELTPQMRQTLSDARVRVHPSGRIEVPDTWVWDEDNLHYSDAVSTPEHPPVAAEARPVNGQHALDNSVPVGGRPNLRIGFDEQSQQFVELTRVGQRVRGGQVVGGIYRGRVIAQEQLTEGMRAALAKEWFGSEPRAKTFVPGRSTSINPFAEKIGDLSVSLSGDFKPEDWGRRPLTANDLPAMAAEIAGKPRVTVHISVRAPNGARGTVIRRLERESGALVHENARFDDDLPRMVRDDFPVVPDKGTPLESYLTLGAMRLLEMLGADFSGPRLVLLENITNVESIAVMGLAELKGIPEEFALRETHTVRYAENTIIQRGGRIAGARLIPKGPKVTWKEFIGEDLPALARRYPKLAQLPADAMVWTKYDVELDVEPAVPAPAGPAPAAPADTP
jgi:hypothetical protein